LAVSHTDEQLPVDVSSPAGGARGSLAELSSEEALLCTQWFLKKFRRGELAKLTLDEVPDEPRPPRQHREGQRDGQRERRPEHAGRRRS